ncbi:MAG: type IV pilin [Candidatus Thermoplasmatota archaeon]|nr:type IV pilin [Candidatus Thermoplasmatota archaeon]
MRSSAHIKKGPGDPSFKRILGVSEAIGTILLLGISVMLAGSIALWTANIDEGEDALYVDLWATVQGNDLVIVHKGGDILDGMNSQIIVSAPSIGPKIKSSYYDLSGDNGWGPGEEVRIDISGPDIPNLFKVTVTSVLEGGTSIVLLSNELTKSFVTGDLPDLAVTRIQILKSDGTTAGDTIFEDGPFYISIQVDNYGSDMETVHFAEESGNRISNLRIFDSDDPLEFTDVKYTHYSSSKQPHDEDYGDYGELKNGEYMVFEFKWDVSEDEPRSLGIHTLNVKVIPVFEGELNYRNNYIGRKFRVDKELTPVIIHGPDPGIYDIYFSDEAPNSGEEITVTVIVQNSGDEPITQDMGVTMIVTTFEPKMYHEGEDVAISYANNEVYDWRMDKEGYSGKWRSEVSQSAGPLSNDEMFPTCVRTDLELLPGAYLFYYFSLEARVDVPGGKQRVYAVVDAYNEMGDEQAIDHYSITSEKPSGDVPRDNIGLRELQVLPRILLVDDDEALTESYGDMTSAVLESLIGAGVTVDKTYTTQQVFDEGDPRDAPAFSYNQEEIAAPAMEDYDIVIWVTGYKKDPLTNSPNDPETGIGGNVQELIKYLDSNRYLMIVGTDPFDGLMKYFQMEEGLYTTNQLITSNDPQSMDASDLLYKYLGIHKVWTDVKVSSSEEIPRFYSMDIYVDLMARIDTTQNILMISHEEGDPLDGDTTSIVISDQGGVIVFSDTYSGLTETSGEEWSSGTFVTIPLSIFSYDHLYDIEITSERESGSSVIIYKNKLNIPPSGPEDPSLTLINYHQDGVLPRDFDIVLLDPSEDNTDMDLFTPRDTIVEDIFEIPIGILTNQEESGKETAMFNSVRAFSTPDPVRLGASYKSVVMAWDVTQIKYLNEKIDLFSNVLKWFDWEVEVGRDLAVTRMNLYVLREEGSGWMHPVDEDNPPKYLDTILIEAYIRNNGPNMESSSVVFYVTGPDGMEVPITPDIPYPDGYPEADIEQDEDDNPYDINGLSGGGTEIKIYKLWLAVGVGTYTFRVVVDPYTLITEISEDNNDISYSTSTITSFITKNNILVVDDDMSDDNFPSGMEKSIKDKRLISYSMIGGEPSLAVIETLVSLEMVEIEDYYEHEVTNTFIDDVWGYDSGLTIFDLKRYNSVIWITGGSGLDDDISRETFTDKDLEAIKKYLDGNYPEAKYLPEDHHENLMVIGNNFMTDLTASEDEIIFSDGTTMGLFDIIQNYFGIKAVAGETVMADSLEGPKDGTPIDKVFFGIDFPEFVTSFNVSSLTIYAPATPDPYARSVEGLYAGPSADGVLASIQYAYDDTDITPDDVLDDKNFRVVLHSWELTRSSWTSDETPLMELLYLPLHWFETPEDEPELVGRSCDIGLERESTEVESNILTPVIGNSYVIHTRVANIGGASGGGTVRFTDGNTLFQSENIYLNPDTTTTIEAIWKPLYAGERTITIWIDKYNDALEVFDVLNNVPSMVIEVYFFWDDMESGDGNWDHDSTIQMINGEGTLDYMAEPTYTNIEDEWSSMNGFHVNTEVENTVVQGEFYSSPNSFYMYEPNLAGTTRKDIDLVMMLDTSVSMSGNPIADMKIAAKNIVDLLAPDDRLAIFTFNTDSSNPDPMVRQTFTYMTDPNRASTMDLIDSLTATGFTPLWDSIGATISYAEENKRAGEVYIAAITLTAGDDIGSNGREDGSDDYCPGSEPGTTYLDHTWGVDTGSKWGDSDTTYVDQDTNSGHDIWRVGGDSVPLTGAWLDLNDHTRTGLIHAPIPVFTVGLGIDPHEEDPESPGIGLYYPFTSEYDLWQIAETSGAQYHYAPDSSSLDTIFRDIFLHVEAEAEASTRGEEPTRAAGPWTDGNEIPGDKWMETNTIDLTYADSAWMTFKNKYNMKVGANGGVIQVGTYNGIQWVWEYIQPDQPYTGNFLVDAWGTVGLKDGLGGDMRWCYNGMSGGGTLGWDHVSVNLDGYTGNEIRVRFLYKYLDGGTGYGWMIDDMSIKISTDDENTNKGSSTDGWRLQVGSIITGTTYSGTHAWWVGDVNVGGDLMSGVDNSLYTRQIDLTNARTAILEARFRFNIDTGSGRPPDGFRVEVSTDNKQTWVPLNLGVRAAWGVSGTGDDNEDGIIDSKSYTGLDLEGKGKNWVHSSTLTRLNTDLAAFIGNVINIRFRLVTNTDLTHYADNTKDMGIYIDDVFICGTSLSSTRGGTDVDTSGDIQEEGDPAVPDMFREFVDPKNDGKPYTSGTDDILTGDDLDAPECRTDVEGRNDAIPWILSSLLIAAPMAFLAVSRRRGIP